MFMIDSKIIEKAVYDLCVQANTALPDEIFEKLLNAYENETSQDAKQALGLILKNAKMAYEKKMPLCQDTGQVLVFVRGRGKHIPDNINEIINNAITRAYEENYFRKSIVKDAVFDRKNTKTNTPCVIYTEITDSKDLEIEVLLKGAGCENVSVTEMLSPTATEDEIIDFVVSSIKKAGSRGCPPYFLGIGIGGTMEYAGILSKKALLLKESDVDENNRSLVEKIQNAVNKLEIGVAGLGGASTALSVKILTDFTHIACMPIAVTVNCHSSRHSKCIISEDGSVKVEELSTMVKNPEVKIPTPGLEGFIKVNANDIDALKSLKAGQKILLSGEIYTARDMAHKRLVKMLEEGKNGEKLPFDLKDKIIFYAGPCPSCEGCVTNSIGPTTASRMDKFAPKLYNEGVLATIGKGERSEEVKKTVKQVGGLYFTVIGGIACLLAERFINRELVAFEDLGTEAIYKFEVKDLPLRVDFC